MHLVGYYMPLGIESRNEKAATLWELPSGPEWSLQPQLAALLSRNKLPSRMYRRTICTLRCPVWFIIDRSDAPAIAAAVACPARSECPADLRVSRLARSASS
jgi:hypothetical protein